MECENETRLALCHASIADRSRRLPEYLPLSVQGHVIDLAINRPLAGESVSASGPTIEK
jgi:hypothetical protein